MRFLERLSRRGWSHDDGPMSADWSVSAYADFVESLTPEEYTRSFPLHILRLCHVICDNQVMYGASRALKPETQYNMSATTNYEGHFQVVSVLLEYHDRTPDAQFTLQLQTAYAKQPLDLVVHACIWLYHTVRHQLRDTTRPLKPRLDTTVAHYLSFLDTDYSVNEKDEYSLRGFEVFLRSSVLLGAVRPVPEHVVTLEEVKAQAVVRAAAAVSEIQQARNMVAFERSVEGLPPCLQRARLNMLRPDTGLSAKTDLWWQVFPDEKTLAQVIDPTRHHIESGRRNYVMRNYPSAPSCKTLIGSQRCPLSQIADIEDLPARKFMNRATRKRAQENPQAVCAEICGLRLKNPKEQMYPAVARRLMKRV